MAFGISCAETGLAEAMAILDPFLEHLEEFVKQIAMIAMRMILQQQNDKAVPYCKKFKLSLRKFIKKKRNDLEVF
jgi:26S proteasome regulatory subunit N2